MYYNWWLDGIPTLESDRYVGAFYEDNRRVYFFYQPLMEGITTFNEQQDVSIPRLYMDFGAQPGDELEVWTPNNVGIQHRSIISVNHIDALTREGRTLRCIRFTNKTENDPGLNFLGSNMNFWMEGIGAPTTPTCHVYGNASPYRGETTYFVTDVCHIGKDTLYTSANLPAPLMDEMTYSRRPFIEAGKRWQTTTYVTDKPLTVGINTYDYGTHTSINTYYFNGDTVIAGQGCAKMMRDVTRSDDTTTEYVGAFRQDGRRVWCYAPGSSVGCLLYDFQTLPGDPVCVGLLYSERDTTFMLQPHKPIQASGVLMKSVCFPVSETTRQTWVEGVGSLSAPMLNVSAYRDGTLEELRCCQVSTDTLYSNLGNMGYIREQVCEGLHCMTREPGDTFVPFVEEGKSWIVARFKTHVNQVADDVESLTTYRIEGDTVIADITSKRLVRTHTDLTTGTTTNNYVAALYDDGRRVMFFPAGFTTPYLMHDFCATAGDTVLSYDCESLAWQSPSPERFVRPARAIAIGYSHEILGGCSQSVSWYQAMTSDSYKDGWIQGVGGTHGPTHVAGSVTDSRNQLMLCKTGECVLYRHENYSQMLDGIGEILEEDKTNWNLSSHRPAARELFDLTGRRLAAPPARGLYIEDGKIKIIPVR